MNKWIDVESSAIKQVMYDKKGERLHVLFKNNKEYMYLNVPEFIFNNLMEAESFGTVFNRYIKNDFKNIDLGIKQIK